MRICKNDLKNIFSMWYVFSGFWGGILKNPGKYFRIFIFKLIWRPSNGLGRPLAAQLEFGSSLKMYSGTQKKSIKRHITFLCFENHWCWIVCLSRAASNLTRAASEGSKRFWRSEMNSAYSRAAQKTCLYFDIGILMLILQSLTDSIWARAASGSSMVILKWIQWPQQHMITYKPPWLFRMTWSWSTILLILLL